jgi:hypothetical protein
VTLCRKNGTVSADFFAAVTGRAVGSGGAHLLGAALNLNRSDLTVLKEGEAADHQGEAHRAVYYALVAAAVEVALGVGS